MITHILIILLMIGLNVGILIEVVVSSEVSVVMKVLVGVISDLLILCIRILVILMLLGEFYFIVRMFLDGKYLMTLVSLIFFFDVLQLGLSLFTLLLYFVSLLFIIHQAYYFSV